MSNLSLEEQSFINLVNHLRPQLERIMKGESANKVIPEKSTRLTLRNHGVLVRRRLCPTEEAKRILEED